MVRWQVSLHFRHFTASLAMLIPARFCKANAQIAHSLIHWKYALNEWVIDRLKLDGHLEGPKLAEREDWNKSKRSKYANRIVDDWENVNEIKTLYRDFKNNLEVARQGKPTRWSK